MSASVPVPRTEGASGTRSRARNTMARTRLSILDGAAAVLAARGAHGTTMAEIAIVSGVAKATLYNHFRTRAEVYALLAVREANALSATLDEAGSPESGLREAADRIARHPVVRGIVDRDPSLTEWFVDPRRAPALWSGARHALGRLLDSAPEDAAVDVAIRWLASLVLTPGSAPERAAGAALLAHEGSRAPMPAP